MLDLKLKDKLNPIVQVWTRLIQFSIFNPTFCPSLDNKKIIEFLIKKMKVNGG